MGEKRRGERQHRTPCRAKGAPLKLVWSGTLQRMRASHDSPVSYWLADAAADAGPDPRTEPVNPLVGREVAILWTGRVNCLSCGIEVERTWDGRYCFDCFQTRADADQCMMRPQLCHHGDPDHPCRDETFAVERCFVPHALYVSLTSDVKVGITRRTNLPGRWIDQGAVEAMTLAIFPSRRAVGLVEHALAADFRDRTHWMRMLRSSEPEGDLDAVAVQVIARLHELEVEGIQAPEDRTRCRFEYPVDIYPERVRSLRLERVTEVRGVLRGVKGQYWYFEDGVVNIGRHSGFHVEVRANA